MAGISIAAVVALKLLMVGEGFGIHSGSAEEIFTFVLLYGGGVDYSLLFISRYREFIGEGRDAADSVALALDASLPAIVSSAVMTVSGLAMLCLARFSIFRHAGPAVMLALVVAALAAATLVPAMLAIVGPAPSGRAGSASRNPAGRTHWAFPPLPVLGERVGVRVLEWKERCPQMENGPHPNPPPEYQGRGKKPIWPRLARSRKDGWAGFGRRSPGWWCGIRAL